MSASDELNRRHDKLKKHLSAIANNKNKILDAISKQRWFHFANTSTVIFDRDTNLLWVDSQKFPYGKNGNRTPYSFAKGYAEVRKMLEGKNEHWVGNCLDWTIPTVDEFYQLIEDKTFPLLKKGKIKGKSKWCTQSGCIDLDSHAVSPDDAFILPCSHSLVPSTKLKSTLDIFVNNLLDPIFEDNRISELYRGLYKPPKYHLVKNPLAPPIDVFEKSDLLDYIAELESQNAKLKALADAAQRILQ